VVIGDSVTSIGSNAFAYCYSLTSVVIGDGVTSIGEQAFYYCYSLTSVVIGDSVTSIGSDAFNFCYNLTSVEFKNTEGWSVFNSYLSSNTKHIPAEDLADPVKAAEYLRSTYSLCKWERQ
jgi:hypothetical protein